MLVFSVVYRIVRNRAAEKAKGSHGLPQQQTPPPGGHAPPSTTPNTVQGLPVGASGTGPGGYSIGNILGIPAGTTIATDPNANNIKRKHEDGDQGRGKTDFLKYLIIAYFYLRNFGN